jgi:hypothetical protein
MINIRVLHLVAVAASTATSVVVAGEIFDSPGPGYRQQKERVAPTKVARPVADFRISKPRITIGSFSDIDRAFTEAHRLFEHSSAPHAILPPPEFPKLSPETR